MLLFNNLVLFDSNAFLQIKVKVSLGGHKTITIFHSNHRNLSSKIPHDHIPQYNQKSIKPNYTQSVNCNVLKPP